MHIRTAIPILVASVVLAGFAPASSADEVPAAPPTAAVSPPTVGAEPTTNSSMFGPTTTQSSMFDPTTTPSSMFDPTTTPSSMFDPTTSQNSMFDPPTTTTAPTPTPTPSEPPVTTEAVLPETTATPTPDAAIVSETTTPSTTTTQPETTSPETTTTETTTTEPPNGELNLTTSPSTSSSAEVGARTLTMTFNVTVTDTRPDSAGWTAQAWVTNLVTENGAVTIPASISYAATPTSCSAASGKQVLSNSPVVVQRAGKPCSASWTVTVTVFLPETATIADVYNATIEHSITGLDATPPAESPAA